MGDDQGLNLTLKEVRLGDSGCTEDEVILAKNAANSDPYKSFCVCKDEDNKYYILISAKDGSNIIVPCTTSRHAIVLLRRLQLNYIKSIISGDSKTLTTNSISRVSINLDPLGYFEIKPDATLGEKGKKVLDEIRARLSLPAMEEKEYTQYYTASDAEKRIIDFSIGSIFTCVDGEYKKTLDSIKFDELKRSRKFKKFTEAYDDLTESEVKELYEMFEQVVSFKKEEKEGGKEFYSSRMAQIRCGGKPIENSLISCRYLLEKTNVAHQGEIPRNDRFDGELLRNIIDRIIELNEACLSMPDRKFELVIRRIGLGVNKGITRGTQNMYDSFVSFGSNQGTVIGDVSGKTLMHYKRVLKIDDKALPVDVLLPSQLKSTQSECELLLPPFRYTVENDVEVNPLRNDIYIDMGDIEPIDTIELLKQRILEVRQRENERRTRFQELSEDEEKRRIKSLGYDEFEVRVSQLDFFDVMEKIESTDEFQKLYSVDREITADPNQKENGTPYGKDHVRRMAFFIRLLSNLEGLSEHDKDVLIKATQHAYIGMKDDYNESVGSQSVKKIEQWNLLRGCSNEDKRVIEFLIEQNTRSARENEEAIEELPEALQAKYTVLLKFLQEAERLDAMRHKEDGRGVDPYRLVCVSSQKIINVAYQAYLYFIDYMEDERQKRIDDTIEYAVNRLGIQIDYEEELEESKRKEASEIEEAQRQEEEKVAEIEAKKQQEEILQDIEITVEGAEPVAETSIFDEELIIEDEAPKVDDSEPSEEPADGAEVNEGTEEVVPEEFPLSEIPDIVLEEESQEEVKPVEKTPEEVLSEIVATSVRSLGLERINSSAKNVLEEFEQTLVTKDKVKKKTRDNKEGR